MTLIIKLLKVIKSGGKIVCEATRAVLRSTTGPLFMIGTNWPPHWWAGMSSHGCKASSTHLYECLLWKRRLVIWWAALRSSCSASHLSLLGHGWFCLQLELPWLQPAPHITSSVLGTAPVPGRMALIGLADFLVCLFWCDCWAGIFSNVSNPTVLQGTLTTQDLLLLPCHHLFFAWRKKLKSQYRLYATACYPMEQPEYRVPLNLENTLISQNSNWRWCFTQGNSRHDVGGASQVEILFTQLQFMPSAY